MKKRNNNLRIILIVILTLLGIFAIVIALDSGVRNPSLGPTDDGSSYPDGALCKDSDGGIFFYTAGVVSMKKAGGWNYYPDTCTRNYTLTEYYCSFGPQSVTTACLNGCVIGFAKLKAGQSATPGILMSAGKCA